MSSAIRPMFLRLDGALSDQPSLARRLHESDGLIVEATDLGPALRLWTRPATMMALADRLRQCTRAGGRDIVFAGSGDFHHATLLLLTRAIEAAQAEQTTLVHFDNHPDWVRFDNGVHCGSWVARAARLRRVARVITVGVCSSDIDRPKAKSADLSIISEGRLELYPYFAPRGQKALRLCGRQWPSISSLGETAFTDLLAERVEADNLYITVDKDVLLATDAVTNWDQGQTRLEFLLNMISAICAKSRLIGADIVGDWSPQIFGGFASALLKHGEALMDQPWRRPNRMGAAAINEHTNLTLLETLLQAGA